MGGLLHLVLGTSPECVAGGGDGDQASCKVEDPTTAAAAAPPAEVVVLQWEDLKAGRDLTAEVHRAFGPGGLGLLAVSGVPDLDSKRAALLPLASRLGKLPPEVLAKYERPEASFCIGWSRGQEKFKGKPDLGKGSWYANPIWDDPADGDEAVRKKYPYAASRNIWPEEIPELEDAFKKLGQLVYEVAQPIVKQCDRLVSATYPKHGSALFDKSFPQSRMTVGRLLHYFPGQEESWCGWHNDNSVITGLVPAMLLDDASGQEVASVSSGAGLYVQGREQQVHRIVAPKGSLLFQVGEAAQILSGGVLRATPHHVRGHESVPGGPQVSRETFALFMEPQWDALLGPPEGATYANVLQDEETELIPPLSKRLKPDPETKVVEFGKLLGDSFQEYYKHNNEN